MLKDGQWTEFPLTPTPENSYAKFRNHKTTFELFFLNLKTWNLKKGIPESFGELISPFFVSTRISEAGHNYCFNFNCFRLNLIVLGYFLRSFSIWKENWGLQAATSNIFNNKKQNKTKNSRKSQIIF